MNYRTLLRQFLFASLEPLDIYPAKETPLEPLRELLSSLSPVETDHELIRLGPYQDGGYLIPDDFAGIQACFSPGVSTESRFEQACAQRGMDVFMIDGSISSPTLSHPLFRFESSFLSSVPSHDSVTLEDWVASSITESTDDLLLQMDIEGAEWEVILSTPLCLLKRFRIIVIEFHGIAKLWNSDFFSLANKAFRKILHSHTCVHIHPNNCHPNSSIQSICRKGLVLPDLLEMTFLRNDRFSYRAFAQSFPHRLDCDNSPSCPKLVLPQCWRGA